MSDMERMELQEEVDIITLTLDDGSELECEVMGIFNVGEKEYIALAPMDGSDDIFLYGYEEKAEDTFDLIDIEDDAEFEAVSAEFEKLMSEE